MLLKATFLVQIKVKPHIRSDTITLYLASKYCMSLVRDFLHITDKKLYPEWAVFCMQLHRLHKTFRTHNLFPVANQLSFCMHITTNRMTTNYCMLTCPQDQENKVPVTQA